MSPEDELSVNIYLIRSAFDEYGVTPIRTFTIGRMENYLAINGKLPKGVTRDESRDARTYMITDNKLYLSYYTFDIEIAIKVIEDVLGEMKRFSKLTQYYVE